MSVPESEFREWTELQEDPSISMSDLPPEPPPSQSNVEQSRTHEYEFLPMTAFPDKWKSDFEGLLYLGYLEAEVKIPYHIFVVRTILPAAKIEMTAMLKDLETSVGYGRAYKAMVTAAGIESVDGRPIVVAQRDASALRQKYNYVINTWYDPIIDILYQAIDQLEGRQIMVMRELGVIPDPGESTES